MAMKAGISVVYLVPSKEQFEICDIAWTSVFPPPSEGCEARNAGSQNGYKSSLSFDPK